MKFSEHDLSGIVEIMHRLYLEILGIEEPFGLVFGNGDFRPRVEHFHDAVRALTANPAEAVATHSRLSVELLAYDLSCLRYIQALPLASFNANDRPVSPHQGILNNAMVPRSPPPKPDQLVKTRLAELYQQYGVLFAALFKPHADTNFHQRTDALNEEVKQLSDILRALEGGATERQMHDAIAHLDNPELRQLVFNLLHKKNKREVIPVIKDASKKADATIATLDKAHLNYVSAQLGIYEEGKDIVKKLASKGMNLAGRFVESAMAAASRGERGRS